MKDQYGRLLQCPQCRGYMIIGVHVPFASSRHRCTDCGYKGREESFRAVPAKAVIEYFNPSER